MLLYPFKEIILTKQINRRKRLSSALWVKNNFPTNPSFSMNETFEYTLRADDGACHHCVFVK